MRSIIRRSVFLLASLLGAACATCAEPVHINPEGIGQVLIYPYYTVRNGWTTLLSIVNNDSANGKAVKLRFLEGKNGALTASLNVFLAPNDVWTAAILAGTGSDAPPRLASNDLSCTFPTLRSATSLAFSTRALAADGDALALQTVDRLREGYFEVIGMADIPFNRIALSGTLQAQIQNFGYAPTGPACTLVGDVAITNYADQITALTGGLSGAATLLNVLGGASAEYSPVAINGFWADGVNAATPALIASTSSQPNLSSGGNRIAHNSVGGQAYFSTFARSIDAVSAVLMTEQLRGEHAYTVDNTIATSWVITMPTKRFYTQSAAVAPFTSSWDTSNGSACEDIGLLSFDRESSPDSVDTCGLGVCPPPPRRALCAAATSVVSGTASLFGEGNAYGFAPIQNFGNSVTKAGKEGGRIVLTPSSTAAKFSSTTGQTAKIDAATGDVAISSGAHAFYGLPMIGLAFTQSSFKTGNPQQNYASGFRLQSTRRITTP